jgi:hypothetical protein
MLLAAGYFRARIPKLHPFDKMLGGLAWCIISSNVEVDVDLHFDEDMTLGMCWQGIEDVFLNHSVRFWFFLLGHKIKLGENVIAALKKMKCPSPLQPHQLRGLDFQAIQPTSAKF